jgi:hypothetical protein
VFAVPQTPIVPATPPVQSALVQQPFVIGTHNVPPAQLRRPLPHWMPQFVPSQVELPLPAGEGSGQALQRVVPQLWVLVLARQKPLQLCVPAPQLPLQAVAMPTQAPLHSCMPVGHIELQARPSQVAVPPVGTGQAAQDVVPQLPTSLLLTHLLLHKW